MSARETLLNLFLNEGPVSRDEFETALDELTREATEEAQNWTTRNGRRISRRDMAALTEYAAGGGRRG